MLRDAKKIYVAGHRGMVGSAIVRKLQAAGYQNLLMRTHVELDLLDQSAVRAFMLAERPDYMVVAAAKAQGCEWLLSLELPHEAQFDSVRVINPLQCGPELLTA